MNFNQILANSNDRQVVINEAVKRLECSDEGRSKVRLSHPVQYQNWTIRRLSMGGQHATMAFDKNTVRCLALSLGRGVNYSILDTQIEGIENLFLSWVNVNAEQ